MNYALIIGSEGQDGRLLFDLLLSRQALSPCADQCGQYAILGIDIGVVRSHKIDVNILALDINTPIDITNKQVLGELIRKIKPCEIYYLAACHQSSEEASSSNPHDLFVKSYQVNVLGLLNTLEAMRLFAPEAKLFYASSSFVFGEFCSSEMQDEQTPFNPTSIYGMTKLDGILACRYYRKTYGVFASAGIFYNHESVYRRPSFISKKIIRGAIDIKNKRTEKLLLGDLSAEVDFGYAPDYVVAMHRILSLEVADDFIIASGKKHSIKDFVAVAFSLLGLDWEKYVFEDKNILKSSRWPMVGNAAKLQQLTGWKASVDFKTMIKLLLRAEGAEINETL